MCKTRCECAVFKIYSEFPLVFQAICSFVHVKLKSCSHVFKDSFIKHFLLHIQTYVLKLL